MNDDFGINWNSNGSVNYTWNSQPFYHDYVRRDPVTVELEHLDRLESIVQLRDTTWVEEYFVELNRSK